MGKLLSKERVTLCFILLFTATVIAETLSDNAEKTAYFIKLGAFTSKQEAIKKAALSDNRVNEKNLGTYGATFIEFNNNQYEVLAGYNFSEEAAKTAIQVIGYGEIVKGAPKTTFINYEYNYQFTIKPIDLQTYFNQRKRNYMKLLPSSLKAGFDYVVYSPNKKHRLAQKGNHYDFQYLKNNRYLSFMDLNQVIGDINNLFVEHWAENENKLLTNDGNYVELTYDENSIYFGNFSSDTEYVTRRDRWFSDAKREGIPFIKNIDEIIKHFSGRLSIDKQAHEEYDLSTITLDGKEHNIMCCSLISYFPTEKTFILSGTEATLFPYSLVESNDLRMPWHTAYSPNRKLRASGIFGGDFAPVYYDAFGIDIKDKRGNYARILNLGSVEPPLVWRSNNELYFAKFDIDRQENLYYKVIIKKI